MMGPSAEWQDSQFAEVPRRDRDRNAPVDEPPRDEGFPPPDIDEPDEIDDDERDPGIDEPDQDRDNGIGNDVSAEMR